VTKDAEAVHELLLSARTQVTCPKCESRFSLQEGFASQALEKFEQSTEGALESVRQFERTEAEKRSQFLAAQREKAARAENAQLQQLVKEQSFKHSEALNEVRTLTIESMAPQLAALRSELTERQAKLDGIEQREAEVAAREQKIQARIDEEAQAKAQTLFAADRQALEEDLANKSKQVAELRSTEVILRRQKMELEDRAASLELEVARKLEAGRTELETRIRNQERENAELEKAELKKRLADMNIQLAEAQRKGAQGSQQLQGEVLELTLEQDLQNAFPLDTIEEVRKGVRGGDVVQRVMTRSGQSAGTLLWEAKRAKDWSGQWVGKLKEDLRACGADVAVLVTIGAAFPRDWDEGQLFGLHEDIWVTSWSTALQLATVLRSGLLDVQKQRLISAGKGEKMEAVYDYLTSSQFAQKLKAVYGSFYRMRQELESEKSQTMQRWARRERQLQNGIGEIMGVAGDIQGLAQQDLPLLEIAGAAEVDSSTGRGTDASQLGLRIDKAD
jgi:hypothetical protein